MSSSVLYFPIIHYRYVRKEHIELDDKFVTQEKVEQCLQEIERECDEFKERKWIDSKFSGLTALFPATFLLSMLFIVISSITSLAPGVWYGAVGLIISILLLIILIFSSYRISQLDKEYRKKIEQCLRNFNQEILDNLKEEARKKTAEADKLGKKEHETGGLNAEDEEEIKFIVRWEVGQNNTLEIHQHEDMKFEEYYDEDEYEANEIEKVTEMVGKLIKDGATTVIENIAYKVEQLDHQVRKGGDLSKPASRSVSISEVK